MFEIQTLLPHTIADSRAEYIIESHHKYLFTALAIYFSAKHKRAIELFA